MAQAVRNVRVRFGGDAAGLRAASAEARRQLQAFQAELKRQEKAVLDAAVKESEAWDRRSKAMQAFVSSSVKGFAKVTLAGAAMNTTLTGMQAVVPVVAALGGALAILPGALAAGGVAAGTFKLGMDGITEAAEAAKPAVEDLKREVSATFAEGLLPVMQDVAREMPKLTSGFKGIAREAVQAAENVADVVTSGEGMKDVRSIMDSSRQMMDNLADAAAPLVRAFLKIGSVGADVFADLTEGAGDAAERFAEFIDEAARSGELREFMEDGIAVLKEIGEILGDLGAAGSSVFGAIMEGSGGLSATTWGVAAQALRDFAESAEGQEVFESLGRILSDLGEIAGTILKPALQVIGDLIVAMEPVIDTIAEAFRDYLGPALQTIADILGPLFEALSPVVEALVEALAPILPLLADQLRFLAAGFIMLMPVILMLVAPLHILIGVLVAFQQLLMGDVDGAIQTVKNSIVTAGETMRSATETDWGAMAQEVLTKGGEMSSNASGAAAAATIGVKDGLAPMPGFAGAAGSKAADEMRKGMVKMQDRTRSGASGATDIVGGIPDMFSGALSGAAHSLVSAGVAFMDGLKVGIANGLSNVLDFVGGIANQIAMRKGPLPYDRTVLIPAGLALMEGLRAGINTGLRDVLADVSTIAGQISDAIPGQVSMRVAAHRMTTGSFASRSVATSGGTGPVTVAAPPVNVYIGPERLDERVDYRINEAGRVARRDMLTGRAR